jgi:hypothetical protein
MKTKAYWLGAAAYALTASIAAYAGLVPDHGPALVAIAFAPPVLLLIAHRLPIREYALTLIASLILFGVIFIATGWLIAMSVTV